MKVVKQKSGLRASLVPGRGFGRFGFLGCGVAAERRAEALRDRRSQSALLFWRSLINGYLVFSMALLCDWQEKVKLTEASVVFHLRTGRVDVELVHHCAERGTDLVDLRGPIQQLEASAAACFDPDRFSKSLSP